MKVKIVSPKLNYTTFKDGKPERAKVGTIINVAGIPAHWSGMVEEVDAPKEGATMSVASNPKRTEMEADYLELTGDAPDKRWSDATLLKKLEEAASA